MSEFWSKLLAKPWLRVQACIASMGAILLAGSATYATYRVKDSAVRLGSEIFRAVELEGGEVIEFNGARFHFAANVVTDELDAVAERAARLCEQDAAELASELAPALSRLPAAAMRGHELDARKLLTLESAKAPSVREIGCFRRPTGSARGFMQRVKRFAETGDFSEFGTMSYVRVERHGDKTLVRALWSEGRLAVSSLFPAEGDVPGADLRDVPRPRTSTRILAARIVGTDRRVVGYDTELGRAELNEFYGRELLRLGWKELDLGAKEPSNERPSRAFERGERRALLALTPSAHGTSATFVELVANR
ncbi:MAG TPA: hypothetical protein VFQ35_03655 [Polyangiaceae bacterium]|nr:hypothetical protein [Polyangiaceae bacterium]